MKIYQIIQGIDNTSAGPSYSVGAMSHFLTGRGNDVEIAAFGPRPTHWPFDAKLRLFDGRCERIGLTRWKTVKWIREASRAPVILHGHSVWRIANLFPLAIVKNSPAKIVWSPRGTFSEWSWNYRAVFKRPFWYLLQRTALSNVGCFHATSVQEYEDIRRRGFRGPVAVIPNGVDIPHLPASTARRKKMVFLGRIHPVKGIELLLSTWKLLAGKFPEWELVIAGPLDNPHAHAVVQQFRRAAVPRVSFPGEVTGAEKFALLADASLFVLPSYSENFGMVVAEALAHGVSVVTTTGTPWREIETRRCGWFVAPEHDALLKALSAALTLPLSTLHAMGERGRHWMISSYGWPQLAERMQDVYTWLLQSGERPACVITD